MRTKYLFAALVAAAALLLPCAARAQGCDQGACESWATVDPSSNTIYGGSYYENYNYDSYVWVESIMFDPNYSPSDLGGNWSWGFAEYDFSGYVPDMDGTFTLEGQNYYLVELPPWVPDGYSDTTVDAVSAQQGPEITSCAVQGPWAIGSNSVGCSGYGLTQGAFSVGWSGNNGSDFLQSDSVTVSGDGTQVYMSISLGPLVYSAGSIILSDGNSQFSLQVPMMMLPGGACAWPVNFVQNAQASMNNPGPLQMLFTYSWGSSSGNLADLAPCSFGELVTLDGTVGNPAVNMPSPPFPANASFVSNPVIIWTNGGMDRGSGTDTVGFSATAGQFVTPFTYRSVNTSQQLQWQCPCVGGAPVTLASPAGYMDVIQQPANTGPWVCINLKSNIPPASAQSASSSLTLNLSNR